MMKRGQRLSQNQGKGHMIGRKNEREKAMKVVQACKEAEEKTRTKKAHWVCDPGKRAIRGLVETTLEYQIGCRETMIEKGVLERSGSLGKEREDGVFGGGWGQGIM